MKSFLKAGLATVVVAALGMIPIASAFAGPSQLGHDPTMNSLVMNKLEIAFKTPSVADMKNVDLGQILKTGFDGGVLVDQALLTKDSGAIDQMSQAAYIPLGVNKMTITASTKDVGVGPLTLAAVDWGVSPSLEAFMGVTSEGWNGFAQTALIDFVGSTAPVPHLLL